MTSHTNKPTFPPKATAPPLPSLHSNILKSLNSVHLPPPPSSRRATSASATLVKSHSSNQTQISSTLLTPESVQRVSSFTPSQHSLSSTGSPSASKERKSGLFQPQRLSASFADLNTPDSVNGSNESRTLSNSISTLDYSTPTAATFAAAISSTPLRTASKDSSSDALQPSALLLSTPPASQSRVSVNSQADSDEMLHQGFLRTPTLAGNRTRSMKNGLDENKENSDLPMYPNYLSGPPLLASSTNSSPLYEQKINAFNNLPLIQMSYPNSQKKMLMKPHVLSFNHNALPLPPQSHTHNGDDIPAPKDMPPIVDDGTKPPYSYATLIGMAILRSSDRKLTLSQIYKWINDTFLWYQTKSGWQNSIRHNLSLNKAFRKQERPKGDPGKGHYWIVEPGCEFQFVRVRTTKRLPSSLNIPTMSTTTFSKDSVSISPSQNLQGPSASSLNHHSINLPDISLQNSLSSLEKPIKSESSPQVTPSSQNNNNGFNLNSIEDETTTAASQQILFHVPSLEKGSPIRKRGIDSLEFPCNDTTNNTFKKKRLTIRSVSDTGKSASFDSIPTLLAPSIPWLPHSTIDDSLCAAQVVYNSSVSIESPIRGTSGLMLGKGFSLTPVRADLDSNATLKSSASLLSPPALKGYRNLGQHSPLAFEFEDFYPYSPVRSSPSRQKFSFYKEEDDLISRACFGSPEKREAKRRDYFEYTGVTGFDGLDNASDVFGVDICQVVKRAVTVPKPGQDKDETDDDNTEDDAGDADDTESNKSNDSLGTPKKQRPQLVTSKTPLSEFPDAEKFLRYNSPIKTQCGVFSPQKTARRDNQYHHHH